MTSNLTENQQPAIWPGAVISSPLGDLIVVDVGVRDHSQGYGKVDMTATHAHCAPGTMIQTPWGMAEVILDRKSTDLQPPRPTAENPTNADEIIKTDYPSLKGVPMFDPHDLDATFDPAPG